MQQAVVSETTRIRQDTVSGYDEAFHHVQHNFYYPLWVAETGYSSTQFDYQLKHNAAVNLFGSLIDPIRAASQPSTSSSTQGQALQG